MLYLNVKKLEKQSKRFDYFVLVEYNGFKRRTTTQWKTKNPEWNETFLFSETDEENNIIKISLFDEDKWSKDDCMKSEEIEINKTEGKNKKIISGVVIEYCWMTCITNDQYELIKKQYQLK